MNTPFTALAAGVAAYLGFSLTTDVVQLAAPRTLTLNYLRLNDDGTVTQQLSGGVAADWSVRVHRVENGVSTILCAGKGSVPGVYTGSTDTWTMNEWVGDDCPDLAPGDEAFAAWEYVNDTGTPVTVIGTIVVGEAE